MKRKLVILSLLTCMAITGLSGCSYFKVNQTVEESELSEVSNLTYSHLMPAEQTAYRTLLKGFQSFDSEIKTDCTVKELERAYTAIMADHPELFYIDGYVYNEKQNLLGNSSYVLSFPNYTYTKKECAALNKKIDAVAKEMLATVEETDSDYDIAKKVYDSIIEADSYNVEAKNGQTILGGIIDNETNCGGYAQTYTYLMQKAGIPCTTITGTLSDVGHMWNIIKLDGYYYLCDLTNGDTSIVTTDGSVLNYVDYSYLTVHPNYASRYVADDVFTGLNITVDQNNYFVQNGTYFDIYGRVAVGDALKRLEKDGESIVTIQFGSEEQLRSAENDLFGSKQIQLILGNKNIKYFTGEKMNTLTIFLQ